MEILPPEALKSDLKIPTKILMGPGPSNCPPRVLHALSLPTLGHMHPETFKYMDEIKEGMKYLFQTRNRLTIALSTSGHGGMDAAMCNLIEEGDVVLVARNGIWGERAACIARRYGANVHILQQSEGNNFKLSSIENTIRTLKPKVFFITQGESSTGVYQPIDGIGDICHRYNCISVVDTVASLGAVPLFTDKWRIDVVYTGSQKVISAPPGLTPITFSERAWKVIQSRKTKVKVFYYDMNWLGDYWNCFGRPRVYHHTISTPLVFSLREALAIVTQEGLSNTMHRHKQCAKRLYDGIKRMGMQLYVREPHMRLPTVTSVVVPEDADWRKIIAYAMEKYQLEISGGLGPTANKVLRIGLMGYNATSEKVDFLLKVLREAYQHARYTNNNKL